MVEFLVDNTLGRLWFNATGGQTSLRERCQYLLAKPDEQPVAALRLRDPRTGVVFVRVPKGVSLL